MDIMQYASDLLLVNKPHARKQAIAFLSHALQHERKWNAEHKKEVRRLISWLETDSVDVGDIQKYH